MSEMGIYLICRYIFKIVVCISFLVMIFKLVIATENYYFLFLLIIPALNAVDTMTFECRKDIKRNDKD